MVRSGLSAFLYAFDDQELVREASSGEKAIILCIKVKPNIVLMDLVMPEMDGATATKKIREQCPDIQVIALTSFKEQDLVEEALQAGAIGYLLKDITANELATPSVQRQPVSRPYPLRLLRCLSRRHANRRKKTDLI